jgi:hydrogenase maturation protease
MTTQNETLVLGIGNTLLSDEGAGIHALNLMQSTFADHSGFTFLDGGTLSFTLARWIEDCGNLIVFDAAELHLPAGSVKTLEGADMDAFLGAAKRSAHEVGLMDLMDIARLTDHLPANRALIGIQPETMGWGMQPTDKVEQALPKAVEQAAMLMQIWNTQPSDIAATAAQLHHDKTLIESPDTGAQR